MYGADQRRSLRVPFQVPARILGPLKAVEGQLDDLSRTGARLRVPLCVLHLETGTSMADLGARVGAAIRPSFEVEIHWRVLGPLLTKSATLVRLALPPDDPFVFDLGCVFDLPLSNEETVMLGVPLPALKEAGDAWIPRADVAGPIAHQAPPREGPKPERQARPPRGPAAPRPAPEPALEATGTENTVSRRLSGREVSRWRGFVMPSDIGRAPVLSCLLDEVSRLSVRLRVMREAVAEDAASPASDPAALSIAFSQRYGDSVGLKIMEGASHLWTGPTRVRAVEVPPGHPGEALVTLAFDRSLTPPELSRLHLA